MKLGGQESSDDEDFPKILNLSEVTIAAKPKELRKIAKFLKRVAKEIKKGNESDHYHFRSNIDKPDLIVINEAQIT